MSVYTNTERAAILCTWGSVVLSRRLTHNMWSHTQPPVQAKQ